MNFDFEFHQEAFVITPALVMEGAQCENPDCEQLHVRVSLSWLFWTVGVVLAA